MIKAIIAVAVSLGIIICGGVGYLIYNQHIPNYSSNKVQMKYSVVQGRTSLLQYDSLEEAIENSNNIPRSVVVDNQTNLWIHTNLKPFILFIKDNVFDFDTFDKAIFYANNNNIDTIYYRNNQNILWEKNYEPTDNIKLDIHHIKQFPELPRGCEVTSLAMMLNYYGVNVDKVTLAYEVKKDTTEYQILDNGKIYYGNPYDGFVGDMYSLQTRGYGVYHGPIYELANNYLEGRVVDITGANFDEVIQFLSRGYPIWAVTNGTYSSLPDSEFEIWHTPTGIVKITKRMHAVVLTGYENDILFINDPLSNMPNREVNLRNFQQSWEQMGHQAIVILD
ncbi:MAG: hypothetical protein BEN18_11335 [Epulopiscium sp. Nuni2H_MBin001]|nr:MAG: hypothetical protein BEN18_11335 [Epulopiscium sp. Nuni2H_MBin001]